MALRRRPPVHPTYRRKHRRRQRNLPRNQPKRIPNLNATLTRSGEHGSSPRLTSTASHQHSDQPSAAPCTMDEKLKEQLLPAVIVFCWSVLGWVLYQYFTSEVALS